MDTTVLINEILLGGLLGVLGQGIRMAVGLNKLHTSNVTKALNNEDADNFSVSRLILSIFIGFIAGAIALLIKGGSITDANKTEYIFAIMAAGYSGADFIEGIFKTYISKINPPSRSDNTAKKANQQPLTVPDESN